MPQSPHRPPTRPRSGRWGAVAASALALVVLAAGCSDDFSTPSNAGAGASGSVVPASTPTFSREKVPVTAPGVTDSEIRLAGIASVTNNPVSGKYGTAFDGAQAYFDMVNAQGGIYGRKLVLQDQLDDKVANNSTEVQRLLTGANTFAVLPVAVLLFSGADALTAAGTPTFGWNVNLEWESSPNGPPKSNLFGQAGSRLCGECALPLTPWLAQESGRHKVGLLAYNVPQSATCASGTEKSFDEYGKAAGAEVAYVDKSLAYGIQDLSVQVSKMKDAGVDFIFTCMDTNAVVALARESKKQGLDAIQLLPNGYDQELLKEYGDLFEGSYVRTDFIGLESTPQPPGMQRFVEWIGKAGKTPTENAIVGWLNADLFVKGLQGAGPNFSQQAVVDAINKMTTYNADGMLYDVDWTKAHTESAGCHYVSKIEDSTFKPAFADASKPFQCPKVVNGKIETNATAATPAT